MDLSNENMIHIKNGDVEYLQFRILNKFDNIINCYSLKPLDFKSSIGDRLLEDNYRKICKSLEFNRNFIIRPHQNHTDVVISVDDVDEEFFDVDGLICEKKNIGLMLSFADCTPIFLYDFENKIIANVHSGWRGTAKKIGQKAVLKMFQEYNSKPENIIACIGPCIGRCHFEVENDVKDIFEENFRYLNKDYDIIEKVNNNKFLIDTTLINRLILEEVGINRNNIYESGICTVCYSEYMHSFREEKEEAGRNIALLGMI